MTQESNVLHVGTDRYGRTWRVLDRDDSFSVYYTTADSPAHHVIYDSLDAWRDPPRVLLGRAEQAERRVRELEMLARDLLARLSRDYGDYEGELERDVAELFIRGDKLLPTE